MAGQVSNVERTIAALARRSHGVVTRRQLLAAGITAPEIDYRLPRGDLIAVFRGVYRVGHRAPSVEAGYIVRYERAVAARCSAGWPSPTCSA